jgi:RNA polymerase sigma factor (TIGR02999 family)
VTQVLEAVERGDSRAADRLLPLVYEELRQIAGARMREEPAGHTLQPTALVHEAYLRLVGDRQAWSGRAQFFAAASLAMRRILVDRARRVRAQRHGGGMERRELTDVPDDASVAGVDLVALDGAMEKLEKIDDRLSRVVQLRFFAGLSVEQVAELMETSERTVKRDWNFARAWLHKEMVGAGGAGA